MASHEIQSQWPTSNIKISPPSSTTLYRLIHLYCTLMHTITPFDDLKVSEMEKFTNFPLSGERARERGKGERETSVLSHDAKQLTLEVLPCSLIGLFHNSSSRPGCRSACCLGRARWEDGSDRGFLFSYVRTVSVITQLNIRAEFTRNWSPRCMWWGI